jgi:hypothetical protein
MLRNFLGLVLVGLAFGAPAAGGGLFATSTNGTLYCPGEGDWTYSGGSKWEGNGWTVTGSGSSHGKAAYNLLGGYVEFDMDTTNTTGQTNTNFYTTSPDAALFPAYCDIQANKSPQCMEMDIIEANGNCAMATTWHTDPDHNGGCDEGGCAGHAQLPSGPFKVRAAFDADGTMTTFLNGQEVAVGGSSADLDKAKGIVIATMKAKGAMFQSSQWQGWVPSGQGCPGKGDLSMSIFSIANVKVMGEVVQGQEPPVCSKHPNTHERHAGPCALGPRGGDDDVAFGADDNPTHDDDNDGPAHNYCHQPSCDCRNDSDCEPGSGGLPGCTKCSSEGYCAWGGPTPPPTPRATCFVGHCRSDDDCTPAWTPPGDCKCNGFNQCEKTPTPAPTPPPPRLHPHQAVW